MTSPEPLLQVRDLRVQVGERTVLHSVSLDVNAGSLVVLMGANGSGKSTLGLALAGHPAYQVLAGQALLAGKDLLALPAHERARAGLFLSFQSPPGGGVMTSTVRPFAVRFASAFSIPIRAALPCCE